MTEVRGIILDSPIEERLIRQFNYIPVQDNSKKPYQALWTIEDKKFKLHLVNAFIDKKQYYTNDIVPEYDEFVNDNEIFFHYKSYSGTLIFIVDKIQEPGFFSYNLEVGDKIYITVIDGIVTDFDKRKP